MSTTFADVAGVDEAKEELQVRRHTRVYMCVWCTSIRERSAQDCACYVSRKERVVQGSKEKCEVRAIASLGAGLQDSEKEQGPSSASPYIHAWTPPPPPPHTRTHACRRSWSTCVRRSASRDWALGRRRECCWWGRGPWGLGLGLVRVALGTRRQT